jgi:hypothetical protein
MHTRLLYVALAALSVAATLAFVLHYPVLTALMVVLVLAACGVFIWRVEFGLLLLPALLPVIGFAPWTGWITFEELDVLVLTTAAGGYARLAWPAPTPDEVSGDTRPSPGLALGAWLLTGMFALSALAGMYRGIADAGGFSFGWFQGYQEPMNSVRVGKSFFLALLLLPLWRAAYKTDAQRAQTFLTIGLMLGLAAAAVATLWERAAFVDVLNFSADYRTTALFWEMHVGGAALDGFLALTLPFALRELQHARTPLHWAGAAAVLALVAYACLTTFSRGVYLAVPLGTLVFFVLNRGTVTPDSIRSPWIAGQVRNDKAGWLPGLVLVAGFGAGAAWMFQTSGYRGMAAWLGVVALLLPLAQILSALNTRQWVMGVVAGFLGVLALLAVSLLFPKGAYVAWGLGATFTVAFLWLNWRSAGASAWYGALALSGFLATMVATAMVASHWGEARGLQHAVPVLAATLGLCLTAGLKHKPLWPADLRWQASAVGAMGLVAACVGVMGGGAYMGDRFSAGAKDMGSRVAHWRVVGNMLQTPADWWLGKGLGRFAANYSLVGNPLQRGGDYRLGSDADNRFLTLTGGLQVGATPLRVIQRVAAPGKQATLTARVRTATSVTMWFEVCERHLLYVGACFGKTVVMKGTPGVWQDLRVVLQGAQPTRGAWYAPRLLAFAMAVDSTGGQVDLDDVALADASGQPMLVNSDFSGEMAHWFFSSDRSHLPWHTKNLVLNLLLDQGVVGLALWLMLFGIALWRLSFGQARAHALAPALAAALVGFAVVGLFDSLLDVPRLAWLYYFLLMVALGLPVTRTQRVAR